MRTLNVDFRGMRISLPFITESERDALNPEIGFFAAVQFPASKVLVQFYDGHDWRSMGNLDNVEDGESAGTIRTISLIGGGADSGYAEGMWSQVFGLNTRAESDGTLVAGLENKAFAGSSYSSISGSWNSLDDANSSAIIGGKKNFIGKLAATLIVKTAATSAADLVDLNAWDEVLVDGAWPEEFGNRTFSPSDVGDGDNSLALADAAGISVGSMVEFTTTGTLPGGLSLGTAYVVSGVVGNVVSISLGTSPVTFTSGGTGTHTISSSIPAAGSILAINSNGVGYNVEYAVPDSDFEYSTLFVMNGARYFESSVGAWTEVFPSSATENGDEVISAIIGGRGNSIGKNSRFGLIAGGERNMIEGDVGLPERWFGVHNTIVGGSDNKLGPWASGSSILASQGSSMTVAKSSAIVSSRNGRIEGGSPSVGSENSVVQDSYLIGGNNSLIRGANGSHILGGSQNIISGASLVEKCHIVGGQHNVISNGDFAVISMHQAERLYLRLPTGAGSLVNTKYLVNQGTYMGYIAVDDEIIFSGTTDLEGAFSVGHTNNLVPGRSYYVTSVNQTEGWITVSETVGGPNFMVCSTTDWVTPFMTARRTAGDSSAFSSGVIIGGHNNVVRPGPFTAANYPLGTIISGYNNTIAWSSGTIAGMGGLGIIMNSQTSIMVNSGFGFIGGGSSHLMEEGSRSFIGNGYRNTIYKSTNTQSMNTIVNGEGNLSYQSSLGFIGSGEYNTVSNRGTDGALCTVVNGTLNVSSGAHSFIGSGHSNVIGMGLGGYLQYAQESTPTNPNPSVYETRQDYAVAALNLFPATQAYGNTVLSGTQNGMVPADKVVGYPGTSMLYNTVIGGASNRFIDAAEYSMIGHGRNNTIHGNVFTSAIVSGSNNILKNTALASILGGQYNTIWGGTRTVASYYKTPAISESWIGSGEGNALEPNVSNPGSSREWLLQYATILNGYQNVIRGNSEGSSIRGGYNGLIKDASGSVIDGGFSNRILKSHGSYVSGERNLIGSLGDLVSDGVISITSITDNYAGGYWEVTTSANHGLSVENYVSIKGTSHYNVDTRVTDVPGLNVFRVPSSQTATIESIDTAEAIGGVTITSAGSGYVAGPVIFTGGKVTAPFRYPVADYTVDGSGSITGISISDYGYGFLEAPLAYPSHPGNGGAILTPTLSGVLAYRIAVKSGLSIPVGSVWSLVNMPYSLYIPMMGGDFSVTSVTGGVSYREQGTVDVVGINLVPSAKLDPEYGLVISKVTTTAARSTLSSTGYVELRPIAYSYMAATLAGSAINSFYTASLAAESTDFNTTQRSAVIATKHGAIMGPDESAVIACFAGSALGSPYAAGSKNILVAASNVCSTMSDAYSIPGYPSLIGVTQGGILFSHLSNMFSGVRSAIIGGYNSGIRKSRTLVDSNLASLPDTILLLGANNFNTYGGYQNYTLGVNSGTIDDGMQSGAIGSSTVTIMRCERVSVIGSSTVSATGTALQSTRFAMIGGSSSVDLKNLENVAVLASRITEIGADETSQQSAARTLVGASEVTRIQRSTSYPNNRSDNTVVLGSYNTTITGSTAYLSVIGSTTCTLGTDYTDNATRKAALSVIMGSESCVLGGPTATARTDKSLILGSYGASIINSHQSSAINAFGGSITNSMHSVLLATSGSSISCSNTVESGDHNIIIGSVDSSITGWLSHGNILLGGTANTLGFGDNNLIIGGHDCSIAGSFTNSITQSISSSISNSNNSRTTGTLACSISSSERSSIEQSTESSIVLSQGVGLSESHSSSLEDSTYSKMQNARYCRVLSATGVSLAGCFGVSVVGWSRNVSDVFVASTSGPSTIPPAPGEEKIRIGGPAGASVSHLFMASVGYGGVDTEVQDSTTCAIIASRGTQMLKADSVVVLGSQNSTLLSSGNNNISAIIASNGSVFGGGAITYASSIGCSNVRIQSSDSVSLLGSVGTYVVDSSRVSVLSANSLVSVLNSYRVADLGGYNKATRGSTSVTSDNGEGLLVSNAASAHAGGAYNQIHGFYDGLTTYSYASSVLGGAESSIFAGRWNTVVGGNNNNIRPTWSALGGTYNLFPEHTNGGKTLITVTTTEMHGIGPGDRFAINELPKTSPVVSTLYNGIHTCFEIVDDNQFRFYLYLPANSVPSAVGLTGTLYKSLQAPAEYCSIVGGLGNTITGGPAFSSIVSGSSNTINGSLSSIIAGGGLNSFTGSGTSNGFIGAGMSNSMSGSCGFSFIGSGNGNVINGTAAFCFMASIVGGSLNSILGGDDSFIGGGMSNTVSGASGKSSILGGRLNALSSSTEASILGGLQNTLSGSSYASIVSGSDNSITADSWYTAILSGKGNTLTDSLSSVIAGGDQNIVSGATNGFIGSGLTNSLAGAASNSAILSGQSNSVSASDSMVGSGSDNMISSGSDSSVISGGEGNTITVAPLSVITGGKEAEAFRYAEVAHSSGKFDAVGDAQYGVLLARNVVPASSTSFLYLDGAGASISIKTESVFSFTATLTSVVVEGADVGKVYVREAKGVIKNLAGTTSIVGSVTYTTIADELATSVSLAVAANDTDDTLDISVVNGVADGSVRAIVKVEYNQVSWNYGLGSGVLGDVVLGN